MYEQVFTNGCICSDFMNENFKHFRVFPPDPPRFCLAKFPPDPHKTFCSATARDQETTNMSKGLLVCQKVNFANKSRSTNTLYNQILKLLEIMTFFQKEKHMEDD